MRRDKYDDFTASYIFSKDEDGNTIYERKGRFFVINDTQKQDKLRDIEGYNYFLYGNGRGRTVALVMTTLFVGLPLQLLLIYLGYLDEDSDSRLLPFLLGLPVYLFLLFLQNSKIDKILEGEVELKNYKKVTPVDNHDSYDRKNESFIEGLKSITPDMNIFHLIIFIMIALPFFYFVYMIIISIEQ
jgi:hypothetical protein